ncbi:MAG: LPS export ABC transporter periplasmic protein LptC [Puniceicoccales bacterium]|jgi:hypothetical protein|nr:LPS export ABC transporter periplasmic protein LptC [Puniceicoccales bacterium]
MRHTVFIFLSYLFFPLTESSSLCVYRFSLPLFDKCGVKICDIYGRQADLSNDKALNVSDISMQTSSKDEKTIPKIFVISDQATVNPQDNKASGNGFIAITNANGEFSATGQKWEFLGDSKSFTLNENVQVFFEKIRPSLQ